MDIRYQCMKEAFSGSSHTCVKAFDAYACYDALQEFYITFDKNLVFSKEEYFQSSVPSDLWDDYVIWENGKIIARAAIWKYSQTAWEVAAVSTLPAHRGKGYGTMVVEHCTAMILKSGKIATCTTSDTNTAMRRVAEKAGFSEISKNSAATEK